MNVTYQQEYNQWCLVVDECRAAGVEMNDQRYDRMIAAIRVWGESLAALRRGQSIPDAMRGNEIAIERWRQVTNETPTHPS